ncbi:MAG TPA: YeeE/YedE thiosulfate transporter family protein [Anaerolineales bacterium]|nr:YeeE/YedE thiosulfate transporter family protein [Anaerolineales bacterium]
MNFPLSMLTNVSSANPWSYVIFALIGFGFGYALEMSGFGNSKKLAAQFYFTDLTVLKVMFTAIIVAMVLIFGATGLGILDFNQVWVNLTYLGSGIVGGLIMGVGFVIGGFCPGTSVVSASTGKIDGIIFVLGGFFGAFLFGETEQYFTQWYNNAGYFGRLTLMDVFDTSAGNVVFIIVAIALFLFWGSEQIEAMVAKKDLSKEPKWRIYAAVSMLALAVGVAFIRTPSSEQKYAKVELNRTIVEGEVSEQVKLSPQEILENGYAQVSPEEMFATMKDDLLIANIIDVRDESQFNIFHIVNARNIPLDQLPNYLPELTSVTDPNLVNFVVSNDDALATQAWKYLVAESVPNVYILDGGINAWITSFGENEPNLVRLDSEKLEEFDFVFPMALGDRYICSNPSPILFEELEYEPVIQLQLKRDKSGGGCG